MKKYKPTSSSLRHVLLIDKKKLFFGNAIKHLVFYYKEYAGRNSSGSCAFFNKGGGCKHLYRVIDFKRNIFGLSATVKRVEYDPNRSSFIALVFYINGFYTYILAPFQIDIGMNIFSSRFLKSFIFEIGSTNQVKNFPLGTLIHNVGLLSNTGGIFMRSAGTFGMVFAKRYLKYSAIQLCSGEKRYILSNALATVGSVSNSEYRRVNLGKAGRSRWLGIRPHVRGVAMNPIDHPHGGDTSGGKIHSTPWSVPTKGKLTRKRFNKFVINN